jgi:predicted solute-binding protein
VPVKRLGLPSHFYCKPFVRGLRAQAGFDLLIDLPAHVAIKLREHELDAAFLSPIDFARNASEYSIISGTAISSIEPNETVTLHFREGLHSIRTLAVDPSSTSEIVLAKVMLAEEFDTEPTIIPVMGTLEQMLEKADGALLIGDASLAASLVHHSTLDLVELWNGMTGLPYVYGLWCAREQALTLQESTALQRAGQEGISTDEAVAEHLASFSYDLTPEVRDGFREFLRYAYFHGVLPDIPELAFYPAGAGGPTPDLPISTN